MATKAVTAPSKRKRHLDAACALDGRQKYLIAAAAGMPPNMLGGIISGRVEPSAAQRDRLAEVLNVAVDDLFPEAD